MSKFAVQMIVLVTMLVLMGFGTGFMDLGIFISMFKLSKFGQYMVCAIPVLYTYWQGGHWRNNKPMT